MQMVAMLDSEVEAELLTTTIIYCFNVTAAFSC